MYAVLTGKLNYNETWALIISADQWLVYPLDQPLRTIQWDQAKNNRYRAHHEEVNKTNCWKEGHTIIYSKRKHIGIQAN